MYDADEVPETLVHYSAAWNEPDPDRIAGHLALAVTDEVLFVDPANVTRGPAELEAMIRTARREMPGAEYRVVSGVDGHHGRFRYLWQVVVDGKVVMPGMDVTTVADDGRIERIDGFFGDFPTAG